MPAIPSPQAAELDRLLQVQQTLLDGFSRAREAGISTAAGVGHLRSMHQDLQEHLAVVDRHVYPLLRQLGTRDAKVARALGRTDSTELAAQVDSFYDGLNPDAATFFTDWGELYVSVQRRFRLERTLLFPSLGASPLITQLPVPGPTTRMTTGPVPMSELMAHSRRNTR